MMEMVGIFLLSLYIINLTKINMNKEKKYVFYTLSSSDNRENIRYVGVTCVSLNGRLSQHKYVANHKDKRSTPVSK